METEEFLLSNAGLALPISKFGFKRTSLKIPHQEYPWNSWLPFNLGRIIFTNATLSCTVLYKKDLSCIFVDLTTKSVSFGSLTVIYFLHYRFSRQCLFLGDKNKILENLMRMGNSLLERWVVLTILFIFSQNSTHKNKNILQPTLCWVIFWFEFKEKWHGRPPAFESSAPRSNSAKGYFFCEHGRKIFATSIYS